jgi:hypothetical protein
MTSLKLHREIKEACQELLTPHGGKCWIEYPKRGHGKFYVEIQGKVHTMTIACSPRIGSMAIQHKINDIRRLLRSLGLKDR